MVILATLLLNFAPSTRAPWWALALANLGLTAALAVVAWALGWRIYMALAAGAGSVLPAWVLNFLDEKGWLLIYASFIVLGIGLLISRRKAQGGVPLAPLDAGGG